MTRPRPDRRRSRHRRSHRFWHNLRRAGPGDYIAWGGALGLACASVWLPWDVYLNGAGYGPPSFQFSRSGEVPADVIALREGRSPLFDMVAESYVGDPPPVVRAQTDQERRDPFDRTTDVAEGTASALPDGVDPITTAGVPSDGGGARHVYTLINAGGGLALIADREGIYIVRSGAMLPDGRRVSAVVGRGAGARIVAADETMVRFD